MIMLDSHRNKASKFSTSSTVKDTLPSFLNFIKTKNIERADNITPKQKKTM